MDHILKIVRSDSPLVATAIHAGHHLRPEVAELTALSDSDRLREEDPFTDDWTSIAENRLIATRSRFELDLNRPKEKAVYQKPEDAWGLQLWLNSPPEHLIERSLADYDEFYTTAHMLFSELNRRHKRFLVFDLHSYNYRREGPDGPPADSIDNPEVNLGTGTMDRERWAPVVEQFLTDLRAFDFMGRQLDVRENVKFRGGQFAKWTHHTYPESGCVLSIEVKKFFMDEWTGLLDLSKFDAMTLALKSTVPGVVRALDSM